MPETSTNATTCAAGAASTLQTELGNQLAQGQELWNQVVTWITEKGLTFSIRLLFAAVILLVGAIAIRLVVAAVGRAVEKSGRGGTLFATFACNVTSKVCWIIRTTPWRWSTSSLPPPPPTLPRWLTRPHASNCGAFSC